MVRREPHPAPDDWVQLGIRMSAVFVKSRPDADEIIGEAEAATRTDTGVNSSGFIAGDLVIRAYRPHGYGLDTLDQARDRFAAVRGVTGEWEGQP